MKILWRAARGRMRAADVCDQGCHSKLVADDAADVCEEYGRWAIA